VHYTTSCKHSLALRGWAKLSSETGWVDWNY